MVVLVLGEALLILRQAQHSLLSTVDLFDVVFLYLVLEIRCGFLKGNHPNGESD